MINGGAENIYGCFYPGIQSALPQVRTALGIGWQMRFLRQFVGGSCPRSAAIPFYKSSALLVGDNAEHCAGGTHSDREPVASNKHSSWNPSRHADDGGDSFDSTDRRARPGVDRLPGTDTARRFRHLAMDCCSGLGFHSLPPASDSRSCRLAVLWLFASNRRWRCLLLVASLHFLRPPFAKLGVDFRHARQTCCGADAGDHAACANCRGP